MIRLKNIHLPVGFTPDDEANAVCEALRCRSGDIAKLIRVNHSIDARGGARHVFSYNVTLHADERKAAARARSKGADAVYPWHEPVYTVKQFTGSRKSLKRPVIVGFGPAGMFAAYMLAEYGLCPIVVERGGSIDERVNAVSRFELTGLLDTECNIQFGEGGAGAFSDGKLTTLIKDKDNRIAYILSVFVRHGAPEEILYESHPHLGTDVLRKIIVSMREHIKSKGGEFRFNTKLTGIEVSDGVLTGAVTEYGGVTQTIETDTVFLAPGHSARDTFAALYQNGVLFERKPFSVGVRIEHKREMISEARYHEQASALPAADYKLSAHTKSGRILYTFCMCPGGKVVAAASEHGGVVTNGMSYSTRDLENSNSALLVSVTPEDLPDGLFAGIEFQRKLERAAYEAGGGDYKAPAQTVGDFMRKQRTVSFGDVRPSYPRGVSGASTDEYLPDFVCETLRDGIGIMDGALHGFACDDAVITGVESRSTCPVRIIRDPVTLNLFGGLYPAGEGAGYAGGIMSAASDGMKCVEAYIDSLSKNIK